MQLVIHCDIKFDFHCLTIFSSWLKSPMLYGVNRILIEPWVERLIDPNLFGNSVHA